MEYQAALREWGARMLEERSRYPRMAPGSVDRGTVRVRMDFREGFACCGGSDPDCYCSFAESPSADVVVEGRTSSGRPCSWSMDAADFDFVTVLREVVEAGGGTLTG